MAGKMVSLCARTAVPLLFAFGCDSADTAGSAEGSRADNTVDVEITIVTEGVPHDADGYVLRASGRSDAAVDVRGAVVLEDMMPGSYSLNLTGIHEMCSADANNANGVVIEGTAPIQLTLRVTCPTWTVGFDQAHRNSHSMSGSYLPFTEVLRDDGYSFEPLLHAFTPEVLSEIDILVITNALHPRNAENWSRPVYGAFEPDEVETVRQWVADGGRLLLIADHMPFPGAAADLAAAFGVEFNDGFAFDSLQISAPKTCLPPNDVHVFRRADGTLADHAVTRGRSDSERVDFVASFTGQAFRPPADAASLMIFNSSSISLMPETAWEFPRTTPRLRIEGWSQGAVIRVGEGRAAFFGEAAMFSEQTCYGDVPMGFQAKPAAQNARFIINTLHWLSGMLD